ncbi:DsbA family oxidoreductase [Vreelandella populi]|uniref:DsbA family oxidoreductase n=1 Tax=Vreelandella populi TaxID=2498858 RepID=UPI0021AE573D|nr:DsbA family protein [Halomonas populi]
MQNRETPLQLALFDAYFGEAKNPAHPQVLREKAIEVGLYGDAAEAIARSDQYANDVRAAEQRFMETEVNAVPGIILDGRYLISGARASRSIWRHTRGAMCLVGLTRSTPPSP